MNKITSTIVESLLAFKNKSVGKKSLSQDQIKWIPMLVVNTIDTNKTFQATWESSIIHKTETPFKLILTVNLEPWFRLFLNTKEL